MNIAEDILRYNLQNTYILTGTACGGKTTMAKAIACKYGFIHFNDNYHEENFVNWQKICDARYKDSIEYTESQDYDWEHHFNRSPEEYNKCLGKAYLEYFEYAIIEIIKFAQKNVVVADIGLLGLSTELIKKIVPKNRVACLLAPPEFVIKDYYDRDDHRDIYEAIMRLREPEKALENMRDVMKYGTQAVIEEVQKSGLFYIIRNNDSTVENTLKILERHFELA